MNKKETSTAFKETGLAYKGNVEDEFDLIVVGSGPGGYLAAEEAGKQGLKTLIVEKEFWGGVCLNVGCIPTKALLASAHIIDNVKNASQFGLVANFEDLKLDLNQSWIKMHERKAGVVKQISGSVKMLMKGSKCSILEGEAKFVGSHEIEVLGKIYRGKNIILATGSRDRKLDMVPGFKEAYEKGLIITSKEAINYAQKRPESVTIVGGGVIGVEFAQVFITSGVKVTIIQNAANILFGMDLDIVKEITKHLTAQGVEIIVNAQTKEFKNGELVYEVNGETKTVKSDVTLVAVGRIPNSEGLAEVGIKLGARKEVPVDEYQRTNVKDVYAIGDLTAQNMLAHVAYQHAIVAVEHILGHKKFKYVNKPVPGCIYTHPEIAMTGLTEAAAKEKGIDAFSSKYLFAYLGKAIAAKTTSGFVKLVVDKKDGKILGAQMVGENSTDYIAEIVLAIEKGLTVYDLTSTIHPHPTFNEIVWEAARSAVLKLNLEQKNK